MRSKSESAGPALRDSKQHDTLALDDPLKEASAPAIDQGPPCEPDHAASQFVGSPAACTPPALPGVGVRVGLAVASTEPCAPGVQADDGSPSRPGLALPTPRAATSEGPLAEAPGTATNTGGRIDRLIAQRGGFIASIRYALDGVLRTLLTQRNMKIHWLAGLAVMLVGMALPLDVAARASLIFCVFVVLTMETLNTALEAFVDLHVKHYAKTAMVAKDAAAAAVLLLSAAAVIVFADIMVHQWSMVARSWDSILRTLILGGPLLALTAAILWIQRSIGRLAVLGALAIGIVAVLSWYTRDEIFSLGALSFVLFALLARSWEPRLRA